MKDLVYLCPHYRGADFRMVPLDRKRAGSSDGRPARLRGTARPLTGRRSARACKNAGYHFKLFDLEWRSFLDRGCRLAL